MILVIAGCGGSDSDNSLSNSFEEPLETGCVIGEYRADDAVSFEVCSFEPVSYDEVISGKQLDMKLAATKAGEVWLGDYSDGVYSVDFGNLKNLSEGIKLANGEAYEYEMIDIGGYEVMEMKLPEDLAASVGVSKSYWFFTGEELLLFRDNFNAVAVIGGLKLK